MYKKILFLHISLMVISFSAAGEKDSTEQIKQFRITHTQYRTYHETGMNTTESTVLSIDNNGKVTVTTTRTDNTKRRPKEKKCRESATLPKAELAEFVQKLDSLDIDSLKQNYMGDRISDLTVSEKLVIKIGNNKKEITIKGDADIPQSIGSITFSLGEMRKKYLKKCE